ncbi:MAG TPA: alpha/beta fold hydrolase [Thermoanaerobaculia bacterium]|nr:alpha/beta fold hydrolase [Thermoanaerobaculia bacterium]
MTRRLIVTLWIVAVCVSCATTDPADTLTTSSRYLPRGKYSGNETGPTPVGAIPDVTVRDAARNRDILISIEYPTRGGPHPLVVFSHEIGGSNRAYIGLSSYWTGNGYVVVRPSHGDRGNLETQTETEFQGRVRDVLSVIDNLDSLEQRFPELQGKIDRTRIGVAGHGFGGQTALLLASDPRIKAVVAMAPYTRGVALEKMGVPTLFITDEKDDPFSLTPGSDKWHVAIERAHPVAFTGRYEAFTEAQARHEASRSAVADPALAQQEQVRATRIQTAMLRTQEMFGIVRASALAFFDAYLKGSAEGRTALENMKERRGVTIERR